MSDDIARDELIREIIEKRLNEQIEMIPVHMREAVRNYIYHRIEPGDFLYAVLTNDLSEAACRADDINKLYLAKWGQFLIWALPRGAWGSKEKVDAWLEGPRSTPPLGDVL